MSLTLGRAGVLIEASSAFNPADLNLNGWWRAAYGGSPWGGLSSLGLSGGRDLADANPPTSGSPLNSLNVADYDGSNDRLLNALTVGNFWAAGSASFVALVNIDSIAATAGYDADPKIFGDSSANFALLVADGGCRIRMGSGNVTAEVAVSTGTWTALRGKCNGTNMFLAKNSVAFGAGTADTGPVIGGTLRTGTNYNQTSFFNGKLAELMLSPDVFSDATFTSIIGYLNTRYGLAL